jgi:hypothetical protein
MNWQNQANFNFLGICFASGLLASNLARANPAYFWLSVVFLVCVALSLFLYGPPDADFQGLWHFGGLALIVGSIVSYWELLAKFSQWQVMGAIAIILIVALAGILFIGAIGGKK